MLGPEKEAARRLWVEDELELEAKEEVGGEVLAVGSLLSVVLVAQGTPTQRHTA